MVRDACLTGEGKTCLSSSQLDTPPCPMPSSAMTWEAMEPGQAGSQVIRNQIAINMCPCVCVWQGGVKGAGIERLTFLICKMGMMESLSHKVGRRITCARLCLQGDFYTVALQSAQSKEQAASAPQLCGSPSLSRLS